MENITGGKHGRIGLGVGESSSEPNLATGERDLWLSGFPPGFTVDELRWYRKKKPPVDWGPKDNLYTEPGSMKIYKTEYARRFKKFDYLPASSEDLTDSNETYIRRRRRRRRPMDLSEDWLGSHEAIMEFTSEQHDKFVPLGGFAPAQIIKRSSSLQRDGEFLVKSSEMHSNYKKYEDAQKAEIYRRPASLRLEGDMNITTETAEKFMDMLINQRADLAKATSDLKLGDEMDANIEKYKINAERHTKMPSSLQLESKMFTQSEKQDKYIPFNLEERPSLMKRNTNLKLEGQMETVTESRGKYIPLDGHRQQLLKRPTNLHMEGEMATKTESSLQYVPIDSKRPPLAKRDTNLHLEGELSLKPEYKQSYVPFNIDSMPRKVRKPFDNLGSEYGSDRDESPEKIFKSEMRMIPLYRDTYKPYNVEKQLPQKPKGNLKSEGSISLTAESKEIGRQTSIQGVKTSQLEIQSERPAASLKTEGRIESNSEFRSSYTDLRQRPVARRPAASFLTDHMSSQHSETSSQYGNVTRREPLPPFRKDQKGFDERFECQPEYRKAYLAYLTRENIDRLPRAFANFEEPTPTTVASSVSATPELKEPHPKPRYKSPYAPPKVCTRDRSVPRTPRQETVLVPDLSGNAVRRASSIFGPKPLRQAVSRPESPVGNFKVLLPQPDMPQTPKKRKTRAKQIIDKPPRSASRDRSVPSSPCHKHRTPNGKPCQRRHSPCARLSRQGSPNKPPKSSGKTTPVDRKENIPIHLFPPTPIKTTSPTGTYKISSGEEEKKPLKKDKPKVPSRKSLKEENRKTSEDVASFVVLQDNDEINNNKVKKIDGKEKRWMPTWYENMGHK